MFSFIVSLFLLLVGAIALVVSLKMDKQYKLAPRITAIVSLSLAVIMFLFSVISVVPPRTVGVGVAFGKPTKVMENGLHLVAPWEKVEKLDGSVQNDIYNHESSITVRLGNNSTAKVDASIQWQLKTDDAERLFLDYKTFENIQQNLVDRNFRDTLNNEMGNYNPLNPEVMAEGGTDLTAIAKEVEKEMSNRVGDQITIKSVTLPIISFDEKTQARIDEYQSEIARTRIAQQRQETSQAEARANDLLEGSLSQDVLTSKCLDIVAESGQSPIGCIPGSSPQTVRMVE